MDLDAGLVEKLIAAARPDWAALPVRPVVPGGWDNRSFRLGDTLLVRLPSGDQYAAAVAREQRWLPEFAGKLPVEVPVPLYHGAAGPLFPRPWSVYRWIAGETVAEAGDPADPHLAADLGSTLGALRAVPAAEGPRAGAHNHHRGGDLVVYEHEVVDALDRLGAAAPTEARAIWAEARASTWTAAPVWVHGDVAPGNLLMRQGRLAAMIDFGTCGTGDPACDLVMAWTYFTPPARQAFRDAVALDPDTWARARGWALWKALIVLAGRPGTDPAARSFQAKALQALLADP